MLPGVIAGHYRRDEAEIDVARLAERAYVEFVPASVDALDAASRAARRSTTARELRLRRRLAQRRLARRARRPRRASTRCR